MRSIKAFFNTERNHTLNRCKYSFAMKSTSTFGERLEEALGLAKKDRQELANALGISVQALSQVIVGKTKALTAENAARAARELGVDMMWLSTGEGEATVNLVQLKHSSTKEHEHPYWPFLRVTQEMVSDLSPEQLKALDRVLFEFYSVAKHADNTASDKDWGAPKASGTIPAPKSATAKRIKHG